MDFIKESDAPTLREPSLSVEMAVYLARVGKGWLRKRDLSNSDKTSGGRGSLRGSGR